MIIISVHQTSTQMKFIKLLPSILLMTIALICLSLYVKGQFVTTWQTTQANESITIPTTGLGYDYTVDWGDYHIVEGFTGDATHYYRQPGIYAIKITGDFPRIFFNNQGDKDKVLSVDQWGNNPWESMSRAFYGCTKLQVKAADAPNLKSVTSMSHMFREAISMNQPIGHWNVAHVTDMSNLFRDASSFNQDIGDWEVGNVTNMRFLFYGAQAFNQAIGSWDVSKVESMIGVFVNAQAFNQNISKWDVSSVHKMIEMLSLSGLSSRNYTTTLLAWFDRPLQHGVVLGATGLVFDRNDSVREEVLQRYQWVVQDQAVKKNSNRLSEQPRTSIPQPTKRALVPKSKKVRQKAKFRD